MSLVYDRCMCGLQVTSGPNRGMHIRKRSSMTASCPELLYPFRDKKCPGRHEHLAMEGHQADLRRAQVWTWDEAQRVAEGVQLVLEAQARGHCIVPVYPAFNPDAPMHFPPEGSPPPLPGYDPRAPDRARSKCPGCKHRRARNDWTH